MFRNLRSREPAATPEQLPVPAIDLRVPERLDTATFGVG